jgi:hypothetical protein
MPTQVAQFRGTVHCRREPRGPLGLELTGRAIGADAEQSVAFSGAAAPGDLPEVLENLVVVRTGEREFRLLSAGGAWTLTAAAVHVHTDLSAPFYKAIPPQPAPLARRLLFGTALFLARTRAGLMLLRALRR